MTSNELSVMQVNRCTDRVKRQLNKYDAVDARKRIRRTTHSYVTAYRSLFRLFSVFSVIRDNPSQIDLEHSLTYNSFFN